ncbi:hypothetical protein DPMN_146184 [Dreissena polymorpha]|uniref:Uncharacterized protein n=1 Tax=Dreissena polymorpha TaxID=45954 RepID=A0A9D4F5F4_DREPO|nr:hypothetical protein DPMN_146184 [Dreissena polymorpha]
MLWVEQATEIKRSPSELKTWYDRMCTKICKLKKAATMSGQAVNEPTGTLASFFVFSRSLVLLSALYNAKIVLVLQISKQTQNHPRRSHPCHWNYFVIINTVA